MEEPEILNELLASPRLVASGTARSDLESGQVSPDLVGLLAAAVARNRIDVRLIKSGHPMGPLSPAGRVNAHYFYRAADIYAIDGHAVAARPVHKQIVDFGHWLMSLPDGRRASLVMGPDPWHAALDMGDRRGFRSDEFANRIHHDHLHLEVNAQSKIIRRVPR